MRKSCRVACADADAVADMARRAEMTRDDATRSASAADAAAAAKASVDVHAHSEL